MISSLLIGGIGLFMRLYATSYIFFSRASVAAVAAVASVASVAAVDFDIWPHRLLKSSIVEPVVIKSFAIEPIVIELMALCFDIFIFRPFL